MKHTSAMVLAATVSAVALAPFGANAAPVSRQHSNGLITNNIATMQHTLMLNALDNFDGSTAITMGDYSSLEAKPSACTPVYGKTYCEGDIYGDDNTARSSGRSGGETATSGYDWFDWRHAKDKTTFDNFDEFNSNYDLITLGFASDPEKISDGFSQYGGFGGIALAREDSDAVNLKENGGYFGLYRGYHINGFNITGAADLGLLFSDTKSNLGDYDYTSFWAGAGINASYNVVLDNTFTLQPGTYVGYTFIYSDAYESATGANISNDAAHMFEVSPSIRAIAYLVNDLYAILSYRYVFNFAVGGDTEIAGVITPELKMGNYSEYGFSIEKNINRFNLGLSLYMHDGARTGWFSGVNMKYVF